MARAGIASRPFGCKSILARFLARFPSKDGATVPPGSDRSLRGQCPIPAASARDSQQGWCYSTSGIGPLPAHLACLSTRFPARVVVQYLRDRPAPFRARSVKRPVGQKATLVHSEQLVTACSQRQVGVRTLCRRRERRGTAQFSCRGRSS